MRLFHNDDATKKDFNVAAAVAGVRQQWTAWLVYYMCSRLVAGDLEHVCIHGQNNGQNTGLCGEQLAGILKLLCGAGGYNGLGKRSAVTSQPKSALLRADSLEGHKVFLPREEAVSYFVKRGVAKWDASGHGYQGIVCECCYNRCGIMELKQYCAQPKLYGGIGVGNRPERNRRRRYRARTQLMARRLDLQREAALEAGQQAPLPGPMTPNHHAESLTMTSQRPEAHVRNDGNEGNEGNEIDVRHEALVTANEYDHGGVRLVEQPDDYDQRPTGVRFEQPNDYDEPTNVKMEESNAYDHRPTEVRLEGQERNTLTSEAPSRIPTSNGLHTTKRYRSQRAHEHRFLMNYG